ncbi:MAG: signal peptidase I [Candidatus Brocadia sp.]|nr:MAG: signal peptidase I [Candidatus Brocadia sp.]
MYISNPDRHHMKESIIEAVLGVWGKTAEQHLIPITGRSMFPLIRDGDQVLVTHGSVGIRRGDVVVFRCNGTLFAHRVLNIYEGTNGTTFITKGDNNPQFDPPFGNNEFIGCVIGIKRGNRKMTLDTAAWRILGWLIAVSALALAKMHLSIRNRDQNLSERQPNQLTTFMRRGMRFFPMIVRKVVFAPFCWWKNDLFSQ